MAKREVVDCDVCKQKDVKCARISFHVDRRMDAAGSMESVYEYLDFCLGCLKGFTQTLMEKGDFNEDKLYKEWKK